MYTPCLRKKLCQCYFLNNSVTNWLILIIFGMQHHEETWCKCSRTILQIFTEIGSYSTDMELKVSWHSFFLRHGVHRLYKTSKNDTACQQQWEIINRMSQQAADMWQVCITGLVKTAEWSGLEVAQYGVVCHAGTSLAGLKPYCHFFSEKYHSGVLQGQYWSQ